MDPVTAAGLAIGTVSLAFDLFDNCCRCEGSVFPSAWLSTNKAAAFRVLSLMVEVPREHEHCRLRFVIEYNKLLAWGKAVGLIGVTDESKITVTLGTNAAELSAIISRIAWLLEQFINISERWKALKPPENILQHDGEPAELDLSVLSLDKAYLEAKKTRKHVKGTNHFLRWMSKSMDDAKEIVTHPRRIQWVTIDKDAFEALLKDLHTLTERLHQLVGDYRLTNIADITSETYRELVLTHNDVQELKDMLCAITAFMRTPETAGGVTSEWRQNVDEEFRHLLRLKEINRTADSLLAKIDNGCPVDIDKALKEVVDVYMYNGTTVDEQFEVMGCDGTLGQTRMARTRGTLDTGGEKIQAWVEWRHNGDVQNGATRVRVMTLAQMLHASKPRSLCAPTCVGYIDDVAAHGRFGWIFAMPLGSRRTTTLRSLHSILGDVRCKPTLTQRVALAWKLASSLLHLHTCDWLHKGMHSGNVIFAFDGDRYDPETPILSGFEYSRSQNSSTISTSPEPIWDMYRWPSIQNEAPKTATSRKTYDIYSVGLILLEVAHWKTLREIMCLEKSGPDSCQDAYIRAWLLGEEDDPPFDPNPNPLSALRDIAGDKYWEAVTRCIEAHGEKGLQVEESTDQAWSASIGLKIQNAFNELVVKRLKEVSI